MGSQENLQIDPEQAFVAEQRPVDPSPKTILVHLQADNSVDSRLETALSLARACSAHVECLHITPIEAYVAFDSFGGVFVMSDVIKTLDREEADLRIAIEGRLRSEDVSWSYTQVTGNVAGQLVSHAALSDLLVVGRQSHKSGFAGATVGLLGDLVHRARTPLFIAPEDGRPCDPTGVAMIAWDGSYEAANAIRSSAGLLTLASDVQVVQISEEDKKEMFPGTRLLEFLSRHGIHAELSIVEAGVDIQDHEVISATLAARARALNAEYLVMGGYNHSRVGEYIFGGVTRTMLSQAPVPLLIAR